MPKTDSTRYTFLFATAICVVCALLIAASAVGLRERQENNQLVYRQKNVLLAAGLVKPDQKVSDRELQAIFDKNIVVRLIDIKTGAMIPEGKIDARTYDQKKARNDPAQSYAAPPNAALVSRVPTYGAVYLVTKGVKDAPPELVVLPIEGMAMWATVYGFIALDKDGNTVRGLTFYDQQETPGLGSEIGNPKWQALWNGRKAYDASWEPKLKVIKGQAGPPDKDPHRIDGLSGATITSNGISRVVAFWFSKDGYGPYLKQFRAGAKS